MGQRKRRATILSACPGGRARPRIPTLISRGRDRCCRSSNGLSAPPSFLRYFVSVYPPWSAEAGGCAAGQLWLTTAILEYVKEIPALQRDVEQLKNDMSEIRSDVQIVKAAITDVSKQGYHREKRLPIEEAFPRAML